MSLPSVGITGLRVDQDKLDLPERPSGPTKAAGHMARTRFPTHVIARASERRAWGIGWLKNRSDLGVE